ncbi:Stk1 family PASTA domain-containing Ser/Thr kinase [Nostocoides sp. F2B08]|uniref:Stk1 family PASTA domain-containing Ser/Thr kinase n=1 Tax=Nostocoides sp. F2B08 TaxID=2653936 RepID=UPI001D058775|nr:Stk1 family PASTA domain-containing Ser/Thr kinase [Tetrasphaera sp. F2B08]
MSVFAPDDLVDGRYRIVGHIARGGMATVYEALDTRLDRHVALKVMHPALAADDTYVARFAREARSAARLSHPNIVAVHDQGEDDGRIFLVMELVRGRTLRQVLDEDGALSPRAALDIAAPLADALAAAHAAGLIHRDIKPENVIIREDGVVKVTDFGLARAVTSETATSATDALLGTVSYLAPEQVESGRVDARSDVYAAGLVIFEMLTGTKAFTGDNPMYVAYQHVHGGVPVPSSRAPEVPEPLDALVDLATSREPMERPADGAALGQAIRSARARLTEDQLDDRPTGPAAAVAYASSPTQIMAHRTAAPDPAGQPDPGATPVVPLVVRPGGEVVPREQLPDHAPEPVGSHRRRGLVLALVTAVLLAAAGAGAWWFLVGPGSPTTVPVVAVLDYDEAVATLRTAELGAVREDVYDETIPVGQVVSTDPLAGREVRRGTDVAVRVSLGPERYAVPALVGTPADAAGQVLEETMLALGEVTEAYSEEVEAGVVVSVDPTEGTELRRGDPVALVVSKGREPIPVPALAGESVEDATSAVEDAGLVISVAEARFSDSVASGRVISQTPAEGSLFRGDTVTVVPSKGPETVEMPNLVGKQLQEAEAELEALGLQVDVERALGGFFNTVRAQSEEAGTRVRVGSTVTLTIV